MRWKLEKAACGVKRVHEPTPPSLRKKPDPARKTKLHPRLPQAPTRGQQDESGLERRFLQYQAQRYIQSRDTVQTRREKMRKSCSTYSKKRRYFARLLASS